jgi:hypothetical protein
MSHTTMKAAHVVLHHTDTRKGNPLSPSLVNRTPRWTRARTRTTATRLTRTTDEAADEGEQPDNQHGDVDPQRRPGPYRTSLDTLPSTAGNGYHINKGYCDSTKCQTECQEQESQDVYDDTWRGETAIRWDKMLNRYLCFGCWCEAYPREAQMVEEEHEQDSENADLQEDVKEDAQPCELRPGADKDTGLTDLGVAHPYTTKCHRRPTTYPHSETASPNTTRWLCAKHYQSVERLIAGADYNRPLLKTTFRTFTVSVVPMQMAIHQV